MNTLREWLVGLAFSPVGIVRLAGLLVGFGLLIGLLACAACSPRR